VSQIELHTEIGNSEVKQVQEFVSLGGTICSDATCDKDISRRIGIASGIARSLEKIWKAKDVSKETKVLIYKYSISISISISKSISTLV